MKSIFPLLLIAVILFFSCNKVEQTNDITNKREEFVSALDISAYPEIAKTNQTFYDLDGNQRDFLTMLKENGVNTIRLRLWVNPNGEVSSFDEVNDFSKILKLKGFKIFLSVHYSDTWADPANQQTPKAWQGLHFSILKDSVFQYTKRIVNQIRPDYIQIGNEINTGFIHPHGNMNTNYQGFIDLMKTAVLAVKQNSSECKIILQFAGIQGADWFFNQVKTIDYDIIGLSFYPIWHGKSLMDLKNTMQQLGKIYQKELMVAETAYPFTLDWNDLTNNIVGQSDQLILPEYPPSPAGQRDFINEIKKIVKENPAGIGICYWGGELIAWKGKQATNGSPWENQALFDFNNKALPVLATFGTE